jgi:hypothetical protein
VRRLRVGELTILLGVAGVVVALVLSWYRSPEGNLTAWDTFGPAVALLMLSALVGLVYVLATLTERTTAIPVAAMIWSVLFGAVGVVAAIVRLLERPHDAGSLCAGAWVAFAGAVLILVGSWLAMRDERTGLYGPARPPARNL